MTMYKCKKCGNSKFKLDLEYEEQWDFTFNIEEDELVFVKEECYAGTETERRVTCKKCGEIVPEEDYESIPLTEDMIDEIDWSVLKRE